MSEDGKSGMEPKTPEAAVAAKQSRRKRRRMTLPFKIFLWVLGVVLVLTGAGTIFYDRWLADPGNVRDFARGKIGLLFPGKSVRVGSAEFGIFKGLDLRDVEVAEAEGGAEIAKLARMHIDFDVMGLASLTFPIKAVTTEGLFLDLVRYEGGEWNLLPPAGGGGGGGIFSESLSVGLEKAFVSVDDRHTGYAVSFAVASARAMSGSEGVRPWIATVEFGGSLVGQWHLSAKGDAKAKELEAQFRVIDIDLGGGLRTRMPAGARRLYDKFNPSGLADMEGEVLYSPSGGWSFDVTASLKRCEGTLSKFPVKVSEMVGEIHLGEDGLDFEGVEGDALGGKVVISGRSTGYGKEAGIEVRVEVKGGNITEELMSALPEKVRARVEEFHPRGVIDVVSDVKREVGEQKPYDVAVEVMPRKISVLYDRFPVEIEDVTGRLDYKGGNLSVSEVVGRMGESRVLCNGEVMNMRESPEIDLQVVATEVVLDEEIRVLLPERVGEIWKSFSLGGKADASVELKKAAASELTADATVRLKGARVKYEGFPYELTDGRGEFTVKGGVFETGGIRLRRGTAAVTVEGRADGTTGEMRLVLGGERLRVDKEFNEALPGRWSEELEGRGLRGEADTRLVLVKEAGGELGVEEVRATLRGSQFRAGEIGVPVGDAQARLEYGASHLDVTGLDGWAFWDNSLVLMPWLRMAYVCRPPAKAGVTGGITFAGEENGWEADFRATNVFIDDALIARLPEYMAGVLERNGICGHGDVSGKLNSEGTGEGVRATFDISMECEAVRIKLGRELSGRKGSIRLYGESGKGIDTFVSRGTFGELKFAGRQMGRTSYELEKGPYEVQLYGFSTEVMGGKVEGKGVVSLEEGGEYAFSAEVEGLALGEVLDKLFGFKKENLTGTVSGHVEAMSLTGDAADMVGKCDLSIRNGSLWEVPLVLAVFNVLNLKVPERTQFTEAKIRGSFAHGRFSDEEFSMVSDPATLYGRGTIGFDGTLDMTFYSRPGRIPVISLIAGEVGKNIVKARVHGDFASPKVSLVGGDVIKWLKNPFRKWGK